MTNKIKEYNLPTLNDSTINMNDSNFWHGYSFSYDHLCGYFTHNRLKETLNS